MTWKAGNASRRGNSPDRNFAHLVHVPKQFNTYRGAWLVHQESKMDTINFEGFYEGPAYGQNIWDLKSWKMRLRLWWFGGAMPIQDPVSSH